MELLGLAVIAVPAVLAIWFLSRAFEDFNDPADMSDQEILSAIAGQADWLERQLLHVTRYGGSEPSPEKAERRRQYIYRLCKTLVDRHPQPINLFYNATKRAAQLKAEGVSDKVAVIQGVKQRLFADNGVNYMARWHSDPATSTHPSPDRGVFVFADGSRHSPEKYGYMAVGIGWQAGTKATDALFGQDTMGQTLTLARAVRKVRFASDIYFATLEIGIYIWYAASLDNVDHQVMPCIYKGVVDGLGDIRAPNGQPLETDFKALLVDLAKQFAVSVERDVEQCAKRERGAFYPNALPSTDLLLDVLIKGNTNDRVAMQTWRDELATPAGVWLKHMIEASTLGTIEALRDKLAVRFTTQ